jgi:hypothetical protein
MPLAVWAGPIDEDGLRQLLAPSEAEHDRRNTRSKVSGGLTVPVKRRSPADDQRPELPDAVAPTDEPEPAATAASVSAETPAVASPQITKYRVRERDAGGPGPVPTQPRQRRPSSDPDIYIPPPRIETESTTQSQVYARKSRVFGIPIGTWFRAHIERRITNADNGQVEVILDKAVPGKMKALPAGTVLFGQKGFNQVSQRLDISLSNGITPDGFEFDVVATVYDNTKVSGLSGSVVRQRGTEIQSAASKGALASAKALMAATVDNAAAGVLADGVGQVGDELLDNERRLIREPRFLIQVSPQPVLVRVNQTF